MKTSTREEAVATTFSIAGFYGKAQPTYNSKIRNQIFHVAKATKHMEQRPLPCEYYPGILGPPTTWKIFPRQAEAIRFAQVQGEGLMVFSFEGDAVGESGKRNYVVTHPSLMWVQLCARHPNQRCTYEVIRELCVCKLYFDLEFLVAINPDSNGISMTNTFINIICYFLCKEFNIECSRKNVLDLSSTSIHKFSRHLIFNLPGVAFTNNIHVGNFVVMICNKIRDWDKEGNMMDIPHVKVDDVRNLFVLDAKNNKILFCDEGVYTKNRNFRIYKSTKLGKNSPLVIAQENEYVPKYAAEALENEQLFLDSLVTLVDNNCEVLSFGEHEHKVTRSGVNTHCSREQCDSEIEGFSSSPYPEIDSYIQGVVAPGYIRCWYYFSQGEVLVYEIAQNRFCYNIGREHKSNRVMYVVNLKNATYYQKCHDPDCKGFRSRLWSLPESTVFWQSMTDDEIMKWVECVDDNSSECDRLLLTTTHQAEMEDISDELLVSAAEAYEMWDKIDQISSLSSIKESQESSKSNLSQKSNPWNKLSQISKPDNSYFDKLSQRFIPDIQSSQNHASIPEVEDPSLCEIDWDEEFS
ncbi:hypothetical protein OTU49_009470 [Cherax quadricarinatus]|uniref:DNA-directed primase/polymerase protein n=1 Tax=Cherax quadricarinatus TaxID=27406 RepID=A0AAW0WA50_CHEQU